MADALTGQIRGVAALDESAGTLAAPTFKRTLEGLLDADARVTFWDTAFGFESTGATLLSQADTILHMPGHKEDRLYFDSAAYSWFVVFHPGGRMRVGLLA
jgi:hypothetical protein